MGKQYMKLWCIFQNTGRKYYLKIGLYLIPVYLAHAGYNRRHLYPLHVKYKMIAYMYMIPFGEIILDRHRDFFGITGFACKFAVDNFLRSAQCIAISNPVFPGKGA